MELVISCSAALRLDAARRWLQQLPRDGEVLILAPHGHAAGELLRAEVSDSGTRFGVQRYTLDRLAARLALPELARRGAASATSLSLVAVVTRAIHTLLETGGVGPFQPIARRPGFPHAVVRTWQELRGAGLTASSLPSQGSEVSSLATILAQTERELTSMKLADRAEIFRLAREAVERGEVAGMPILLLDLALDQTIETDLVGALMDRAPRGMAIAPVGDARRTAELERMLGVPVRRLEEPSAESSLAMLQRHLFEGSNPGTRDRDKTVTLASWPG